MDISDSSYNNYEATDISYDEENINVSIDH